MVHYDRNYFYQNGDRAGNSPYQEILEWGKGGVYKTYRRRGNSLYFSPRSGSGDRAGDMSFGLNGFDMVLSSFPKSSVIIYHCIYTCYYRYETYLIPGETLIPGGSVSPWYWICLISMLLPYPSRG